MPRSIADREDFLAIKNGAPESNSVILSAGQIARLIFNDSDARFSQTGDFAGMISFSLDPKYFWSFYGEMLRDRPKLPPSASVFRGIAGGQNHAPIEGNSALDGNLPVILASGYTEELESAVAAGLKVNPKPFTLDRFAIGTAEGRRPALPGPTVAGVG
jgi:hypothetical protein